MRVQERLRSRPPEGGHDVQKKGGPERAALRTWAGL